MRDLYGTRWPEERKQVEEIIKGRAKVTGQEILSSAISCATIANKDGQHKAAIMFLAAACDMAQEDAGIKPTPK